MIMVESKTSPIEVTIYDEAHPGKQVPIEIYQMLMPDKRQKGELVKTWVISALYSKCICAFSDTSKGLTAQDKRLMGRLIELQFPLREKDGVYEVDVWFGIEGCYHKYFFGSFELDTDMPLAEACCKELAWVFKNREALYEITNGLDLCSAEAELRCVRCGCESNIA